MTDIRRIGIEIDATRAQTGAAQYAQAQQRIVGATKQGRDELARFSATQDAAEKATNRLRASLLSVGAGFIGFRAVRGIVNELAGFEKVLVQLGQVSGIDRASEAFARLERAARGLGATTQFTAREAGDGLLLLAKAGFTANEQLAAIQPTLNLALAGAISLGDAADITGNAIRQFGLEAAQAQRVVDVLANTANQSNADVSELAESLKLAGPIAGALNISIEETAASLGVLGNAGLKASVAGTQVRGILSGLLDPSTEAAAAISRLGIAFEDIDPNKRGLVDIFREFSRAGLDASSAVEIFQRRQAAGALVLAANVEQLEALVQGNLNATGTSQRFADAVANTLDGSLKAFTSTVHELRLQAGDAGLLGGFRALSDGATALLRSVGGIDAGFSSLSTGARLTADAFSSIGIAAATAGILKLSAAITSVGTALAARTLTVSPFGVLIAAAATAAGAIAAISREQKRLNELIDATKGPARPTRATLANFGDSLNREFVAPDIRAGLQGLPTRAEPNELEQINRLRDAIQETLDLDNALKGGAAELSGDVFAKPLKGLLDTTFEVLGELERDGSGVARSAAEAIRDGFLAPIAHLSPGLGSTIEKALADLKGKAGGLDLEGAEASLAGIPDADKSRALLERFQRESNEAIEIERNAAQERLRVQSDAIDAAEEIRRSTELELSLIGKTAEERERALDTLKAEAAQRSLVAAGLDVEAEGYGELVGLVDKLADARKRHNAELEQEERLREQLVGAKDQLQGIRDEIEVVGLSADAARRLREVRTLQRGGTEIAGAELSNLQEQLRILQDQRSVAESMDKARIEAIEQQRRGLEQQLSLVQQQASEDRQLGRGVGGAIGTSITDGLKTGDTAGAVTGLLGKITDIALNEAIVKPLEGYFGDLFAGEADSQVVAIKANIEALNRNTQALSTGGVAGNLGGSLPLGSGTGSSDLSTLNQLGQTTSPSGGTLPGLGGSGGGGVLDSLLGTVGLGPAANSQSAISGITDVGGGSPILSGLLTPGAPAGGAAVSGSGPGYLQSIGGASGLLGGIGGALGLVGGIQTLGQENATDTQKAGGGIQAAGGLLSLLGLIPGLQFLLPLGIGASAGGGLLAGLAQGGAVHRGRILPFAGGGVLNTPTYFPLAGGDTGLAGEAGPEGILPLRRTRSGALGVQATGGGRSSTTVVFNVNTPNADSFRKSQFQLTQDRQRDVERMR